MQNKEPNAEIKALTLLGGGTKRRCFLLFFDGFLQCYVCYISSSFFFFLGGGDCLCFLDDFVYLWPY